MKILSVSRSPDLQKQNLVSHVTLMVELLLTFILDLHPHEPLMFPLPAQNKIYF